MILYSVDSFYK